MRQVSEFMVAPIDGNLYDYPAYNGGLSGATVDQIPAQNTSNMMLTVAEANSAIPAKPYNVNDMAVDQSELGAEAMPAQLIEQPLTVGKKWLIVGMLVVVIAIGYYIYKQAKKHNKKKF